MPQSVTNFLSHVSAKYYFNWFTVGKVITKIKRMNFLLRHSVVETRQHCTFIYYSIFRFTCFPTIAIARITMEQRSLRMSFVSNKRVSSQSPDDITQCSHGKRSVTKLRT